MAQAPAPRGQCLSACLCWPLYLCAGAGPSLPPAPASWCLGAKHDFRTPAPVGHTAHLSLCARQGCPGRFSPGVTVMSTCTACVHAACGGETGTRSGLQATVGAELGLVCPPLPSSSRDHGGWRPNGWQCEGTGTSWPFKRRSALLLCVFLEMVIGY